MPLRLTERDRRILEHLKRYRLTTFQTLKKLFYADRDESALKSTVYKRLIPGRYLESAPLTSTGKKYFHLGELGADEVGLRDAGKPFRDTATLARRFGVLVFCCNGPRDLRPRFTLEEFSEFFPEWRERYPRLSHHFTHNDYFLDVDDEGEKRLGQILVDTDGSDQLERCRAAFQTALETIPDFVSERRFSLAVVRPSRGQGIRFERLLATTPVRDGYPLRVVVEGYDELGELLVLSKKSRIGR